ncbi:MAG: hypothetical protein AB9907_17565 [Flexilinea sp.]
MTAKKIETKIETNISENIQSVGAQHAAPLQSDPISSEFDIQSDRRATARVARTTNSAESVAQSVRASGGTPLQIPSVQSAPFAQRSVENLLADACRQSGINPKTLLDWAIKENRVVLIDHLGKKSIIRWPVS